MAWMAPLRTRGWLMLTMAMLVDLLARLAQSPMPHIPPCTTTTTGRQVAELENAQTRRPLGFNAMTGKLVVITGGDSGIGLSTATAIARANATIIIASYDPDGAGAAAATKILHTTQNRKVSVLPLDLSSFASVQSFAAVILKQVGVNIDVLINCAGIAQVPGSLSAVTSDGFDRVFQTNYLGHFLLTELLLPRMRQNPTGARVINVASEASEVACQWANADANCLVPDQLALAVQRAVGTPHQNNSLGVASTAYGITKFLQVYHAQELARREALLARGGVNGACADALFDHCATRRAPSERYHTGEANCAMCAGQAQHLLRSAGCSHQQITTFCQAGPGAGVTAYSLHPGVVSTPMLQGWDKAIEMFCADPNNGKPCPISPDEGAATVTYLAVATSLPGEQDGDYFWLCAPKERAAWHGVSDVQAASSQIYNLSLGWVDAK